MKVAVVGLGYVGTVTAACLAANGHDVCGVDVDAAKVEEIAPGRSPVAEPGLDELIAQAVTAGSCARQPPANEAIDAGRYLARLRRHPVDGARRHRPFVHAQGGRGHHGGPACGAARLGPHTVVIRSTVPAGHRGECVAPALSADLAGLALRAGVAMCPEFLREGSGISDFYAPPLIVVGTHDPVSRPRSPSCSAFSTSPFRSWTSARRRSPEVRVQCVSCHQGVLRQRGRPAAAAPRRRLPRRSWPCSARTTC